MLFLFLMLLCAVPGGTRGERFVYLGIGAAGLAASLLIGIRAIRDEDVAPSRTNSILGTITTNSVGMGHRKRRCDGPEDATISSTDFLGLVLSELPANRK
jgi:hypothetical protein